MKSIKTIVALISVGIMVFAFVGCGGNSFDASDAVKADLDLLTSGAVTSDMVKALGKDEAVLKAEYDKEYDDTLEAMMEQLSFAEGDKSAIRNQMDEFVTAWLQCVKYDVDENEVDNGDGSYTVKVTAYPMDVMSDINDYVKGDFSYRWIERIENGQYAFDTEEQLMLDMYKELIPEMTEMLKDVKYEDGVEKEINVTLTDDHFTINESDLKDFLKTCVNLQ